MLKLVHLRSFASQTRSILIHHNGAVSETSKIYVMPSNHLHIMAKPLRSTTAVARDKVANVLLATKGRASGGEAHTAQGLARSIARELLGPLLETACSRLASLLRHAFDIAAEIQQILQGQLCAWSCACILSLFSMRVNAQQLHPPHAQQYFRYLRSSKR